VKKVLQNLKLAPKLGEPGGWFGNVEGSTMVRPTEVIRFWIDEVGPTGWYKSDPEFDDTIREKFQETWKMAAAASCDGKGLDEWMMSPETTLALLIVLDQFSRNMFRGDRRSFATDAKARAVAKKAIDRGWDMRIPCPERQFFYMPLMHSECLSDQDRAVRLMKTRMDGDMNLLHARAHREVIRRFGRFPYRNDALSRIDTPSEREFLADGSYGGIVNDLSEAVRA
jgi:uncharacterized protein (DUF924 family)